MSEVPFLDLSAHVASIRTELNVVLAGVLDEGQFAFGRALKEFEEAFASYCGVSHAVGVASGTDAITIALQAVGVRPGDEVITAANTCVPTVAGIEASGATPVLVDVNPLTYTLDPAALPAALTDRTRALVPVHLYGQCADMGAIVDFARASGLRVVEDAAQAHGAEFRGQRAGSLADAAAFSFYPTKNLGALGDGGAVVTDDATIADAARLLRSYGERERYYSIRSGWNSRLDTLQAAVLLFKLGRLDPWNERRRALASLYSEALSGCDVQLPLEAEGRRHVYHLYVVRVANRAAFRDELAKQGVQTLVHYPRPVHLQPAYEHLKREIGLDISERICAEVVSLPLYPELTDDQARLAVTAVRRALSSSSAHA